MMLRDSLVQRMLLIQLVALVVKIGLVTSSQDPLAHPARAEEVKEVTTVLEWLQVQDEDLALQEGNWAYHKLLPGIDDLHSPTLLIIEDVLPEAWDNVLNLQEANEEPEGELLCSGKQVLIMQIVSCTLISEESLSHTL